MDYGDGLCEGCAILARIPMKGRGYLVLTPDPTNQDPTGGSTCGAGSSSTTRPSTYLTITSRAAEAG
jgi:hypothetical protein